MTKNNTNQVPIPSINNRNNPINNNPNIISMEALASMNPHALANLLSSNNIQHQSNSRQQNVTSPNGLINNSVQQQQQPSSVSYLIQKQLQELEQSKQQQQQQHRSNRNSIPASYSPRTHNPQVISISPSPPNHSLVQSVSSTNHPNYSPNSNPMQQQQHSPNSSLVNGMNNGGGVGGLSAAQLTAIISAAAQAAANSATAGNPGSNTSSAAAAAAAAAAACMFNNNNNGNGSGNMTLDPNLFQQILNATVSASNNKSLMNGMHNPNPNSNQPREQREINMMNHNSSSAFHPQFNMHQQQYQQQQQQQLPHLKQHSLPHQQMHNMHNNNHNNYSPSGGGSGNSSGQQLPNPASLVQSHQMFNKNSLAIHPPTSANLQQSYKTMCECDQNPDRQSLFYVVQVSF